MTLPKPDRYTYFPPPAIFGRTIVPVYLADCGPTIPVSEVCKAMGVSNRSIMQIVTRNRDTLFVVDAKTRNILSPRSSITNIKDRLCIGMDSISMIIMNTDHSQIKDRLTKKRFQVAKLWLMAQVANRIKIPGQKHQPRWDAGLSKDQSRKLKVLIDEIQDMESRT